MASDTGPGCLTIAQDRAATAPSGPLLVLAGPGSGKTLVLAARVAFLIRGVGLAPEQVLVLVFGARTAAALRETLAGALGQRGRRVAVMTFHGWGWRCLRRQPAAFGLPAAGPRLLPERAVPALLARAAEQAGLGRARWPSGRLGDLRQHLARRDVLALPADWRPVGAAYERLLRAHGVVDYPAMLTWPLRLFCDRPALLAAERAPYRAVLLDEAQDGSLAQYRLAQQLAAAHRHLALFGDPNQAIFTWRGADAAIFRRFLADFPERRVVPLRQTFRSSPQIVAAANALLEASGAGRLWTAQPAGAPIRLHLARDEQAEAAFVAMTATDLLRRGVVNAPGDVAVLCRTNRRALPLGRALRAAGLPVGQGGDRDAVHVGTIHRAKGQEWAAVFLLGWEEGELPHQHALAGGEEDLLTERRLAYVAVTRARRALYITACRTRGAPPVACRPSRFLGELYRQLPLEVV